MIFNNAQFFFLNIQLFFLSFFFVCHCLKNVLLVHMFCLLFCKKCARQKSNSYLTTVIQYRGRPDHGRCHQKNLNAKIDNFNASIGWILLGRLILRTTVAVPKSLQPCILAYCLTVRNIQFVTKDHPILKLNKSIIITNTEDYISGMFSR